MNLQDVHVEQIALRDAEMHQLRSSLLNKRTQAILLYGLRFIGKTSLLYAFAQELQGSERYTLVYFDLSENPDRSAKQLQSDLASCIVHAISDGLPDTDKQGSYGTKHVEAALAGWQSDAKLLLAIDDLDVLGLNAFGNVFVDDRTASFLEFLADIGQSERVKFVLVTDGVEPTQVVDTLNSKLGETALQQLSLLDRESTVRLIHKSYDSILDWSDDGVVEYLWAITQGHPHLVRQITTSIHDSVQASYETGNPRTKVTLSMVGSGLTDCIQRNADAPLWVWEQLPLEAQTVASAIAGFGPGLVFVDDLRVELTNARVKNAAAELASSNLDLALGYLRTWHLVDSTEQDCRFTVELFRRWIAKHYPLIRDSTITQRLDNGSAASFPQAPADKLADASYGLDDVALGDITQENSVLQDRTLQDTPSAKSTAGKDISQESSHAETHIQDYDSYELDDTARRASTSQLIVAGLALLMIFGAIFIPGYLYIGQSGDSSPDPSNAEAPSGTANATFLEATPTNSGAASNVDVGVTYNLIDEIPNSDQVWSIALSPDGTRMAAGLANGTITIWNLSDTSRIEQILVGHTGTVSALAFNPQNPQQLISGSHDGTIRLWQVGETAEIWILEGHTEQVSSITTTPDGTMVISASADGTIRLWDSNTGELLNILAGREVAILSVAISPSAQWLASGYADGTALIWNIETGQAERELGGHAGPVAAIAYLSTDSEIVTGSADGTARIWDLSGTADREMAIELQFNVPVNSIAITPNGRFLAAATDANAVYIWDQETQSILSPITNHNAPVRSIAYSRDGDYLVSGTEDGLLRRWQIVQSGE